MLITGCPRLINSVLPLLIVPRPPPPTTRSTMLQKIVTPTDNASLYVSRKTWLLKPFYYYFYTFWLDPTWWHGFPQAVQSYQVKSKGVKNLVKRPEEPGFPASLYVCLQVIAPGDCLPYTNVLDRPFSWAIGHKGLFTAIQGIRLIRSQGRPAPNFCRTTRSHYKPHELCKTSDYSMYMYYYHIIICIILLAVSQVWFC